jgi:hypothetical protein
MVKAHPRAEARAVTVTVIKIASFSMVLSSRSVRSTAYDLLPPPLLVFKSSSGLRFRSLLAQLFLPGCYSSHMSSPSFTVSALYCRIACGHCTHVSANSCAPCSGLPG